MSDPSKRFSLQNFRPEGYEYPAGLTRISVSATLGGDRTTEGTNVVHTFTTSGLFEPTFTGSVEYLVVAGGGAGGVGSPGNFAAGGGGAGGYRISTGYPVISGSPITVTVGAGGASQPGPAFALRGSNGNNSVFGTITSTGGGGGGGGVFLLGYSGGSGGGGCTPTSLEQQPGIPGQGNAGGYGVPQGNGAGGGGGAGSIGLNGAADVGGNGGSGLASTITGVSVLRAGGGGGSGGQTTRTQGYGGPGGGGNGGINPSLTGSPGTVNTGGGGGGGHSGGASGAGGSGVVILRYPSSADLGTYVIN